jgi:NADP-dependent 3-hydroxy acid dehydrogenase YdfG
MEENTSRVWLITGCILICIFSFVVAYFQQIHFWLTYSLCEQTGCSSGFGQRLAKSALARGDRVIATARVVENIKIPSSPNLSLLPLDVTAGSEIINATLNKAAKIWGQVDVLVNNAGVGLLGLLEEGR